MVSNIFHHQIFQNCNNLLINSNCNSIKNVSYSKYFRPERGVNNNNNKLKIKL